MLTLTVNGKKVELERAISLNGYLESRSINPKTVVVELNYEIPGKQEWGKIDLKDGDNLEIVKFIGGG